MKQLLLLLFLLQFQAFAVFAIKDLRVEPAFARPGEEMTIYFSMVHNYNQFISIGGMLSEDNSWEMSDRLFLCNGNAGKLPKENPTDWDLSHIFMNPNQEYIGWHEYSWRFIVPTDLSEGDVFHLILRPMEANQPTIKNLSSVLEASIAVEVSINKDIIYNTATMGEKKATGSFVITQGLPKADLKATPSGGIGGTYTYATATLDVALETNNEAEAKIFYSKGATPVDITDNNQLYDHSQGITLTGDDTINAVAVVPGYSNKKGHWYYKQELPESTLFAAPSVPIPDVYTFSSLDLSVQIGLLSNGDTLEDSSTYEIYYTTHNEQPIPGSSGTFLYQGAVKITGNDTIRAVVVSDNFAPVAEGVWYYRQDLPDAFIVATPSATAPLTYDFTTSALVVDLGVIGGGDSLSEDEVAIYYTHHNVKPEIGSAQTKLYTDSSPITILGDDTIRAIATAKGFNTIPEGIWYYNQELPKAKLEAKPGNNTVYEYTGSHLNVLLSTDSGNTIYYTVNGDTPDQQSPSLFESGEVTVYGNQTIKAIALGDGYRQLDSLWHYKSNLPSMYLRADAGNSQPDDTLGFYFDTTVSIQAVDEDGKDIKDAKIYYLFDYVGNKGSASDRDTLFTNELIIDSTLSIRAIALHSEYMAVSAEWNYKLRRKENWIKAFSSDTSYLGDSVIQGDSIVAPGDTIHFGYDLDVTLETEADSLVYTHNGKKSLFETGDTIHLTKGDSDTVKISVTSYGHGYETLLQQLVFVRDTVKVLSISPQGTSFEKLIGCSLALSGIWRNATLYYDIGNGKKEYDGPLHLEKSTTVQAFAKADFAVDAKSVEEKFIKINPLINAYYRDSNGDGAIDNAYLYFENPLESLPDSISASSPFSGDESIVLSGERLIREGEKGCIASFDTPFTFTGSTFFEEDTLLTIWGETYSSQAEIVADSVAPVLIEAHYSPGAIVSVNPVKRDDDKLTVLFSENVSIEDTEKPFFFKNPVNDYYIRFFETNLNGDKAVCRVKSIHGTTYPTKADSIHIDVDAHVLGGSVVQNVFMNRYVPLKVLDIPYCLIVKAISPVNPGNNTFPDELQSEKYALENGVLIIADFLMKMENSNQDASLIIYDNVGNVVQELKGKSDTNEHIVCDVQSETQTRLLVYWDGKNSLGRDVGSGTYIAHIAVFDGRETWTKHTVHIGVIRD